MEMKGGHSRPICTLAREFPFVVPPAVLSTSRMTQASRTDLVVVNGLSEIFQEPADVFIVLNMIGKALEYRLLAQQPQRLLSSSEFSGRL